MNKKDKEKLLKSNTGLRQYDKKFEYDENQPDFIDCLDEYLGKLETTAKKQRKELKKIKTWLRDEFEESKSLEDQKLFEKMRLYVYFNDA